MLIFLLLLRYSSVDQAYNELYRKNNELNAAKMSLESNIISLQSVLEEEKSTKSDNNQHISELESKYRYNITFCYK